MSRAPLMPKATAVWLVENTALTFRQIADFCGLHELEGRVSVGRVGRAGDVGRAAPGELGRQRVETLLAARRHHELGALSRQVARDAAPDALAGAGDDDDPPVEVVGDAAHWMIPVHSPPLITPATADRRQ